MGLHRVQTDICEFDLDGTIVNTTDAVEKLWIELCKEHEVDSGSLFEFSHGTRTTEVLAKFFPNIDNTDNKYALKFDADIVKKHGDLVRVIPGHAKLLNDLDPKKWCIVTSGNQGLAFSWFPTILSDITRPEVFITAEMVDKGKPDPQGYLNGAKLLCENLNLDETTVKKVVFEDAPVGIQAGVNSGATVVGIASSFHPQVLYKAGATYVVKDLTHVKVLNGTTIELEIDAIVNNE
jgi:2-deoxyglucose-6-phosphatase